jgi:hypothetical protein
MDAIDIRAASPRHLRLVFPAATALLERTRAANVMSEALADNNGM